MSLVRETAEVCVQVTILDIRQWRLLANYARVVRVIGSWDPSKKNSEQEKLCIVLGNATLGFQNLEPPFSGRIAVKEKRREFQLTGLAKRRTRHPLYVICDTIRTSKTGVLKKQVR